MVEYLFVATGGALGSLVRFLIGRRITSKNMSVFPVGTFIINTTGTLLLGLMSHAAMNGSLHILICTGFLGAYTTFSTFMYESIHLFQDNRKKKAIVYIVSSIILGLLGYTVGFEMAKLIWVS